MVTDWLTECLASLLSKLLLSRGIFQRCVACVVVFDRRTCKWNVWWYVTHSSRHETEGDVTHVTWLTAMSKCATKACICALLTLWIFSACCCFIATSVVYLGPFLKVLERHMHRCQSCLLAPPDDIAITAVNTVILFTTRSLKAKFHYAIQIASRSQTSSRPNSITLLRPAREQVRDRGLPPYQVAS